ncbi:MAG TPA: ABC transporter permease [Bacteroidetes bacterium]|nr:ABC transporter permease [Bacteroidota bacterium]
MFQNNLKIAFRNLLKNKVTGFINIAGLAIGMAVAMMIGLWMHDELSFDKFHKNYDRLAILYAHLDFNGDIMSSPAISLPSAPALRNGFGADFADISLASWNFEHLLVNGDKKLLREGMYVEPAFPKMFSLDMVAGDYNSALSSPNSILICQSLATALFEDIPAIGNTIRFDSEQDLRVTGVFNDLPYNSTLKSADYFLPWADYLAHAEWVGSSQDNWSNHSFQLFAEISKEADFASLNEKIKDLERPHFEEANPTLELFPMSRWHLYRSFENGVNVGGRIQFVWLFGIIGAFVLLLACINFMNLSTARSEKRAKEVGVRKTIGSGRGQLIGQFLSESLLVVFLALAFSVALVQASTSAFNNLADKEVGIPWDMPVFWAVLLGFAIITGLLAGSYPAFYLSSFRPLQVLKGTFKQGRSAALPRKVLVTVQFTVSVMLIIGTVVVFQQIEHAKNRPVGYERNGILTFSITTELEDKFEMLRTELLGTGAVEELCYSNSPVTEIQANQIGFEWEGKEPNAQPVFAVMACSYEYGKTMGWEMVEGRDFNRKFATDTSAIIFNEAAAKMTGLDDIVGQTIRWNDEPFHVVGVAKDMIMQSPWEPVRPAVFHVNPDWASYISVRLQPGVPVHDALSKVEAIYKKHSPSSPFEYKFADGEYEAKFRSEERVGKLARVFAILAIFISCLGLFGLSAYVAEQRAKEIGIRKVLGASVAKLWAMQSKGFVGLVIVSCLVAIPLAWFFLESWLSDYDYRIELGWGVFMASGVLALLVTLATVSFQSVKAAVANPVESLRSE